MQVDRTDYIPFMDGVKEIFSQKMKAAKASRTRGWSARTLLKEITEEQSLTPAETDIAWGILTVDILGYEDKKIKELEDAWQKEQTGGINQRNTLHITKDAKGSSDLLCQNIRMD